MSVKIIIDSSSDVNPNISDRLNIVPLTLHFGEEDYLDGVDNHVRRILQKACRM